MVLIMVLKLFVCRSLVFLLDVVLLLSLFLISSGDIWKRCLW